MQLTSFVTSFHTEYLSLFLPASLPIFVTQTLVLHFVGQMLITVNLIWKRLEKTVLNLLISRIEI